MALQEPQIGSSNGIAELEDSGAHGAPPPMTARRSTCSRASTSRHSSRDASSSDLQGLNFVAYARDGVPWFHYTKVNSAATPSAAVHNLSQAQLEGIYSGTIDNWSQVGGANKPIVVFSAQEARAPRARGRASSVSTP